MTATQHTGGRRRSKKKIVKIVPEEESEWTNHRLSAIHVDMGSTRVRRNTRMFGAGHTRHLFVQRGWYWDMTAIGFLFLHEAGNWLNTLTGYV